MQTGATAPSQNQVNVRRPREADLLAGITPQVDIPGIEVTPLLECIPHSCRTAAAGSARARSSFRCEALLGGIGKDLQSIGSSLGMSRGTRCAVTCSLNVCVGTAGVQLRKRVRLLQQKSLR